MKIMIKNLLLLLICISLLFCAIACNTLYPYNPPDDDKPNEPSSDGKNPEQEPEIEVDGIAIIWNNSARYRVVRGNKESDGVRNGITSLLNAIEEQSGVRPNYVSDLVSYNEKVKEIIVGKNNNRPATAVVKDTIALDTFCIKVYEENVVIAGDTDAATIAAVEYFIQNYVSGERGALIIPEEISTVMTMTDWYTANYDKTVTLKKSYSDYISDYEEKMLVPFNEGDIGYNIQHGGIYDNSHSIDKRGALSWDLKGEISILTKILTAKSDMFALDATDKNKTTIKFWLYVSNTDNVVCDHDSINGFQKNQATFYFRAVDRNGKTHCWNHTITNNGWHEIELSFNIHNGVSAGFDYANITGFWVGLLTYDDVKIMIDDMRGVFYNTDYISQDIEGEENARLISDCEYNALDGAIIQEWYGASYDLEDKIQGNSSLHNYGDNSVTDFRTIIANLDIEMDQSKDELVFNLKVGTPDAILNFLIELNDVQDVHEISTILTLDDLKQYGYSGVKNEWCEIRIPLSVFHTQLGVNMGDSVTNLHNFRFCATAVGTGEFEYNIDLIYLAEKKSY